MTQRILHSVARRTGVALGLLVLAGLVVAWTLARGPLTVTFLAPRLESALTRAAHDAGLTVDVAVGDALVTWDGASGGVDIDLRRVHLTGPGGADLAQVGAATLTLDLEALLAGTLRPSRLVLAGPTLHVTRAVDGRFTVAVQPKAAQADEPASGSSLAAAPGGVADAWTTLADLGLTLRDARVVVEDNTLGRAWRLKAPDVRVRRDDQALRLEASLALDDGPTSKGPVLDLALRHAPGTETAAALVTVRNLNPARDLADRFGLTALAGWDQPLDATATLDLGMRPGSPLDMVRFATLSARGGAGDVAVPDPISHAWSPKSLEVDARLVRTEDNGVDITVDRLVLGLPGASVAASARLSGPVSGPVAGGAEIRLSPLTVSTLVQHWPPVLADGAYDWISDNISEGTVRDGRFSLGLGGATWSDLDVTALSGEARADGVTLTYLRGLPAATGAKGTLRFGLDAVTIAIDGGGAGDVRVREGTVAMTALDTEQEQADMVFDIAAPLSSALALIDHQPLGYASKVGIDPNQVQGEADITLSLAMPLKSDLPLDALEVDVSATATGVGVPRVLLGQDLRGGDVRLTLDEGGMDVTGTARVGGVPVTLDWRENFTDGAAFDRRYAVRGRLDNAARATFRLDGPPFQPPWMDGAVDGRVTYTETAGAPGVLTADVDLAPATLALATLGWHKPAGAPATARVEGRFAEESITVDFDVAAGADTARGQARLTGGADLLGVTVKHARLGDSEARVDIVAPRAGDVAPFQVILSGAALDLRAVFDDDDADGEADPRGGDGATPAGGTKPDDPPGPPLDLRMDLARVLVTDEITLHDVHGTASRDAAGRWTRAGLEAKAGGGAPARFTLTPDGVVRRFSLETADAGALASDLDLTGRLSGGDLSLTGTLDAEDRAKGVLRIKDFHLANAPVLARILAVASLTGILDELQGDGLSLSTLIAPFTYADDVLTLSEARSNGPSLGLTANGTLDLASDTMDLQGVVVPVYMVNALLGNIPLLGDLLVGEKGGGVFAVRYGAKGPLDDPSVSVNPLSVVTPGFLRGVFGVFSEDPDGGAGTVPTPVRGD